MDLETNTPPRNTSPYEVRVDYVLCSPALIPRIKRNETRLHLREVGSDHKALLGNVRFDRSKLLVEIKCAGLSEVVKTEILTGMNALGRRTVAFARDATSAYLKLADEDTVILEGSAVERALPSCDLSFEITESSESQKHLIPTAIGDSKIIRVPNVETMLAFIEHYLA